MCRIIGLSLLRKEAAEREWLIIRLDPIDGGGCG